MVSTLESAPGAADPEIREPAPAELARVLHLFRNVRLWPEARLFAAVHRRPVERFVAAAGWWTEGTVGRFQLACQPGVAESPAITLLIERVLLAARQAGMEMVQFAELLGEESPWPTILSRQGFERLRSERSFEIAYRDAWTRVMRLYDLCHAQIPPDWHTDPIRQHPPEVILDVIAPHRLLPLPEVRHYWQVRTAGGFDLDLSCILFEANRPFGAFLARRLGEVIYIDVQVVQEPNPRRRSLGDLCLLYHDAQRVAPGGPLRWIQFRSGETEHRQTANLALRMGGRELSKRHVFGRRLTPGPLQG